MPSFLVNQWKMVGLVLDRVKENVGNLCCENERIFRSSLPDTSSTTEGPGGKRA